MPIEKEIGQLRTGDGKRGIPVEDVRLNRYWEAIARYPWAAYP